MARAEHDEGGTGTPTPRPGVSPAKKAPAKKPAAPRRAVAGPPGPKGYPTAQGQTREQSGLLSGAITAPGVRAKTILDLGMNFLGQPYKWGGATPQQGFDCSGLIQYIYGQNGVKLPRVSADQARTGTAVAAKDAQPGDLIAFDNSRSRPGVDHIGIYLGNGLMLQSPHTGANVQVVKVNLASAATIRRVLPPSAFTGLDGSGTATSNGTPKYVYAARATAGGIRPTTVTPAKGGGDIASNPTGTGAATGATTTAGGTTGLPANATPQQIADAVSRDFGYLAAFMSDKEIGPILRQAAIEDWDESRLMGALSKTNFWKNSSATTRQWDALNKTDHATAKAQVDARIADINARAAKAGITFTSGLRVHDLAVNSLRFGWTDQQMTDALMHEGKLDLSGKTPNDALSIRGTLKQRANSYLVPMADVTLDKWTADVVSGKVTTEAFDSYLQAMAKSLHPEAATAIDSGVTTAQFYDPYQQLAAQELGVAPESVNFADPKWSRALFQVDPKTNARSAMSLSRWQDTLRRDPVYGYQNTAAAKDSAARLTESLLQQFGKVAS